MRVILRLQSTLLYLVLLFCVASAGCSTLDQNVGDMFDGGDAKSVTAPSPGPDGPTIAVEFYPKNGQPERAYLPLDSVTHVQDILERTNAHRKFSRIKIQIYRQLPHGGGHKFDVVYDRQKRRIEDGFDYALHPGDRLQITEDPTNSFDDMLQSIGGFAMPF